MIDKNSTTNGAEQFGDSHPEGNNNKKANYINHISTNPLMDTVQECIDKGYIPIPHFRSAPAPFGSGQSYPKDHKYWCSAEHISLRLDETLLVDYDGHKKEGVLSIGELANRLGVTEKQFRSCIVQTNDSGESLHFLFDRGCSMEELKHSDDGHAFHGVDFKTCNQLMHIKPHKKLMLPPRSELRKATPAMIAVLAKPSFKGVKHCNPNLVDEINTWVDELIKADNVHGPLIRIVGHLVAKGFEDRTIRLVITGVSDRVRKKRGDERAELMLGKELDDAIAGARAKGWAPKLYSDVHEAASFTDELTKPQVIAEIVKDADKLSAIERRRVFEALRKNTKLPFSTLNDFCRENKEVEKESQLETARRVIEHVGIDNILSTRSFVWQWDESGVWRSLEERAVRKLVQEQIEDDEVTKGLVDSVSDLLKTEVFTPNHEFDIGPSECVNTLNGELTLVKGDWHLTPAKREHYRTTQVPIEYDPEAKAPRFIEFLKQVFDGDCDGSNKGIALLEMMGYSLMAHCRHEKFVILVGSGANGKSVLLSVLEALLGSSNVAGVQPSQFDQSFKRAHLHGKLANIVTEIKQGEVIDDASLKGIVSGEPTTVEHKFKDPFDMRPFSTCWFGTNHMPHTRDFSDALFRRALVIEFNQTFKPELGNCDPHLKERLFEELQGILNLALQAYERALEKGFTLPFSAVEARTRWRLEADQVAQFAEEACHKVDFYQTEPSNLYKGYELWANAAGIRKRVALKSFTDRLVVLGYERKKSNGTRYICGLQVKQEFKPHFW